MIANGGTKTLHFFLSRLRADWLSMELTLHQHMSTPALSNVYGLWNFKGA